MNEKDILKYKKEFEIQNHMGLIQIKGLKSTSLNFSVASNYAFQNL